MRVLIVSIFLDQTGYAYSATDYALALDSIPGVDVTCRAIRLNGKNGVPPPRLQELLTKPLGGFDAVIQYLLPTQFEYDISCNVNIGMYCSEFDSFKFSPWPGYINLMDEVWVLNEQSKQATIASGVNLPISVINQPCDIDKFFQGHKKYLHDGPNFRFYSIGEYVKRKNFAALVKAFHLEFSKEEPVDLVIKTGLPGMPNPEERIRYELQCIKEGMRLYPHLEDYKKEILITDFLTEDEIYGLHESCDVYVSPSYGEAWGLPGHISMGFGKTPILSDYAGYREYATPENSWLIPGRIEPCFMMGGVSPPAYATSRDNWFSVDVLALAKTMREAYVNTDLRQQKRKQGLQDIEKFSYRTIGLRMKQLLQTAIERKKNGV